jgi:hypothetical protein
VLSARLVVAFLLLVSVSAGMARGLEPVRNSDAGGFFGGGQAGFGKLDPSPPVGITPDQIVAKFGERESSFAKARDQYTFRETVKIDTIDDDTGKPSGEYQQVTDVVFTEDGARAEHVVFAPQNTLQTVMLTENDFNDIAKRLPFVLTTPELPQYDLTYLGRQRIDEIDTYVFDCKPKELVKGKRYFQGKVWVDQQEFEIVLINGKAVPDNLRRGHEEIDKGYWFPVYTKADGILHFPGGNGYMSSDVHLRYTVKYDQYKQFHAKSRIIYNGESLPDAATATPPATDKTDPKALPPPDPDAPPLVRPVQKPTTPPG